MKGTAQDYSIDIFCPVLENKLGIAPWDDTIITCNLSLTKYRKKSVASNVIQQEFMEIVSHHETFRKIFTGSGWQREPSELHLWLAYMQNPTNGRLTGGGFTLAHSTSYDCVLSPSILIIL